MQKTGVTVVQTEQQNRLGFSNRKEEAQDGRPFHLLDITNAAARVDVAPFLPLRQKELVTAYSLFSHYVDVKAATLSEMNREMVHIYMRSMFVTYKPRLRDAQVFSLRFGASERSLFTITYFACFNNDDNDYYDNNHHK